MCTAFHSKSAQFDAFKTCQMLYKWKIHNSCRTHKTEPLAVTLYKMRTHSQCLHRVCFSELPAPHPDFHCDAAPSLGPGKPKEIASHLLSWHWSFLNHQIRRVLSHQRSINWQILVWRSWGQINRERRRGKENNIIWTATTCQTMGQAHSTHFP